MSASILWEVVKPGKSLGVNAPSAFLGVLREAFGQDLPRVFSGADIPVLRGLRAGLPHEREAFDKLIQIIEEYDEVRVWAQY